MWGTRQEVKKQIRQGKAAVNGTVVKAADTKIDETSDEVTISGRNISYVSYEYYMLNKPGGVVSATEDRRYYGDRSDQREESERIFSRSDDWTKIRKDYF